jgi:hypothetical protein
VTDPKSFDIRHLIVPLVILFALLLPGFISLGLVCGCMDISKRSRSERARGAS